MWPPVVDLAQLEPACGGLVGGHWFRRAVQAARTSPLPVDAELAHLVHRFRQLHPAEAWGVRQRYLDLAGEDLSL